MTTDHDEERADRHFSREIRSALEPVEAPPALWPRIQRDLSQMPVESTVHALSRRQWLTVAAGTVAIAAAGLTAPHLIGISGRDKSMTASLVDDFSEFLKGPRTLDVTEPRASALHRWFLDQVDFYPPNPPLDNTLSLQGGRLCIIHGHRVAVFAYQHADVPIALYVSAKSTSSGAGYSPQTHADGNLAYTVWRHHGLEFVVIAPLESTALAPIAGRLARATLG